MRVCFFVIISVFLWVTQLKAQIINLDGIYYELNQNEETCTLVAPLVSNETYAGDIILSTTIEWNDSEYILTRIDKYAFANCGGLNSVVLPETLTQIGRNAFYQCSSLSTIAIPKNIEIIEEETFYRCSSLKTIILGDVKTIQAKAFSECERLESITLPESVIWLGEGAFRNCNNLKEIKFPSGLHYLGSQAFDGCSALEKVLLPSQITELNPYIFRNCISLTDINFPESLLEIGDYSFYGCSSLEKIDLHNSIIKIGLSAFSFCSSLKEINIISNQGAVLSDYCFYFCISLQNAVLDGITEIGTSCFAKNTEMRHINLGHEINIIGNSAFADCEKLESIYSLSSQPPILARHAFEDKIYRQAELFVEINKVLLYSQTPPWNNFIKISGISGIGDIKDNSSSDLQIEVHGQNISVLKGNGKITIYNDKGERIFEIPKSSTPLSFTLPNRGFYVLVTEGISKKILIY